MDRRIDDDEARRLLLAAGETIEVSPAAPFPRPTHRRIWPALAAAALVSGVIGVGLVWQPDLADQEEPVAVPETADTTALPEESVPVVTGLRRKDAEARLSAAGFAVATSSDYSCAIPRGRVIDTKPDVGEVPTEQAVTLVVSEGPWPAGSCVMATGEDEWGLVDLGSGLPGEVNFADEVTVVLDGGPERTLTRAEALDPATWSGHSVLALLASAAHTPYSDKAGWHVPESSVRHGVPPRMECGFVRPDAARQGESYTLSFSAPGEACPMALDIFRLRDRYDGAITTLIARSPQPTAAATTVTVPDVRGWEGEEAVAALTEAGLAASTFTARRCAPAVGVTAQRPRAGQDVAAGTTVSLTIEAQPRRVDCAGLSRATDDLLSWARGGPAPQLSQRLTLMLGHEQATVLTGSARLRLDRWHVCDPAGSGTCGNALTTLATYDGEIERDDYEDDVPTFPDGTPQPDCTADLGGFPRGFGGWHATLRPPVSVPCAEQWSIHVFVDDAGQINGVDLAPNALR